MIVQLFGGSIHLALSQQALRRVSTLRTDVVEYRKVYLRRLEIIYISHGPPPLCDDEAPDDIMGPHRKDAVLIFHDECIYHSNDDQGWMWGEKGNNQ